jgi:hypothetical protein
MELQRPFVVLWNALFGTGLGHLGERPMRRITIEQKWHQLAETARDQAEKLPHGKEREALERKARQLETASQINQWLSSSELKPPQ